jgi:hypothetical protein
MNRKFFKKLIRFTPLFLLLGTLIFSDSTSHAQEAPDTNRDVRGDLLLIIGASGTEDYAAQFQEWAGKWREVAQTGNVRVTFFHGDEDEQMLEKIQQTLTDLRREEHLPLWIVLIGHGTFDGAHAKFNLPGPDLEPTMLQSCLEGMTRPLAVINCFSASAPFVPELHAPKRVVIAATSSGHEVNFSRFGGFLADSLSHPEADLDKDQQVSLLEAFLRATRLTEDFYQSDGRLATEHAILDDNGDGQPVSAEGFDGLIPVRRKDADRQIPDGIIAHQWVMIPNAEDAALTPEQIARRNEIEQRISQLRMNKNAMPREEYYSALEALLLELASVLQITPSPANPPNSPTNTPSVD